MRYHASKDVYATAVFEKDQISRSIGKLLQIYPAEKVAEIVAGLAVEQAVMVMPKP